MEISKADKNMLARVTRLLQDIAVQDDTIAAAAVDSPKYRELKAKADRTHREIRDLRAFRARIANGTKQGPGA